MNKIKVILIVLILVPVVSVILPSNSVFTNKLCAAVEVSRGNACIDNTTDCSSFPGYKLAKDFFNTVSVTGVSKQKVIDAFSSSYPNGLNTLCIREDFTKMIPVYMGNALYQSTASYYGAKIDGPATSWSDNAVRVAKFCPPGWNVKQSKYTLSTLDIDFTNWSAPYGCCPPGYDFITSKDHPNQTGYQQGICALPSINGKTPDYLKTHSDALNGGPTGIYAADNTLVYEIPANFTFFQGYTIDPNNPAVMKGSWQELVNAINAREPYIYSYNSSGIGAVQPQLGQGFGEYFNDRDVDGLGARVKTGPTMSGAPRKCPTNSACAVIGDGNDINAVIPASRLEQAGNADSCSKCFTAGDTIGTSTAASGSTDNPDTDIDESVGFVRYCNADGTFRDETLLGTPDITKGYLLEDSTNKALYDQCFSTGGIYTAIGCIDPTPTGIITGLIRIALGVMGGVALLQMIYVGILYQQGNTEKIKGARTQLIATLTGVAVLVFSVLILRIIGVNVLDVLSVGSV